MTKGSRAALLLASAVLLAACSTRPTRDGPDVRPPPDLAQRPDAEPRIEPLRSGGPNKPYEIFGRRYAPLTADLPLQESGGASWYGRKFHGQPTASGEIYDMYAMTAAHKTMPIPSYAVVRNPANGRAVVVRVNDRGPFVDGRVIDLSYTAALKLGLLAGVAPVQVQRLTFADIRAGVGPLPGQRSGPQTGSQIGPQTGPQTGRDDPAPGDTTLWLQLGSFNSRQAAQQLMQRALFEADVAALVAEEGGLYRVWVGPFDNRQQALQIAADLRRVLGVGSVPLLERRFAAP